MWKSVYFYRALMYFDVSRWQKLRGEWCKRALLLPTQLWRFREAFWAAKVTFQYMCSEAIMNYFTFYYMLSESKHIFMSQRAPLRKSNKERQMHRLVWQSGSTASQMLPDRNGNQVTLWQFYNVVCSGLCSRHQYRASAALCDTGRLENFMATKLWLSTAHMVK